MKTLKQLLSEATKWKRLTTSKEIVSAIKKYKKEGEILNPEYKSLVSNARSVFEKDTNAGREVVLNHVRQERDEISQTVWDIYYGWPSDSFVSINKLARNVEKFSKEKYFDPKFQKDLVKATKDLLSVWKPVADDLKDMKKIVVKVTQKRAEAKQAKEKEYSQKKADAKVLVKELEKVRKEYVTVAEQRSKEFIKGKLAALKKVGMDLEKILPSKTRYRTREGKELTSLYNMVTKSKTSTRRLSDPDIRTVDKKGVDKYIKLSVEQAEANFDAFVAKMVDKVGPVSKAELTGAIWTNALLTVITKEGEVEKWKTKIIINFSKYGKIFNQFPTRKQR